MAMARPTETRPEIGLDPPDWSEARAVAHVMVDDAVSALAGIADEPAWRDPEQQRAFYDAPLPRHPTPLGEVYREVSEHLMPYPMGNIHPRFFAWFMGSGSFTGAMGEFLAAINGSNLGGGKHAAAMMEGQVLNWLKEAIGFPRGASGALVSGGSMANLMGLAVARTAMSPVDVREEGVAALPKPLRYYASDQVHSCHRKAVEALGLGNRALRRIPTGPDLRIDLRALREAIAQDRRQGLQPACIIGTAGTVNTGEVDDLTALADIAEEEGLWFHVDGCIGALLAIAPAHAHLVAGMDRATSLALDPHKWLQVPFEAGCVLVRDAHAHRRAFAVTPEYLKGAPRGLASGDWLHDLGLQTSRGFRALKLWMMLREQGIETFGRLIEQSIDQARILGALIDGCPELERMERIPLNIVCFRYARPGMAEDEVASLNREILMRLQEQGVATVSDTTVAGRHWLRAAIVNHRTRRADLERLVAGVVETGQAILDGGITAAPPAASHAGMSRAAGRHRGS
jgi:glutamate/tyrosine decarboxylase-like PLP-dependent enzyme